MFYKAVCLVFIAVVIEPAFCACNFRIRCSTNSSCRIPLCSSATSLPQSSSCPPQAPCPPPPPPPPCPPVTCPTVPSLPTPPPPSPCPATSCPPATLPPSCPPSTCPPLPPPPPPCPVCKESLPPPPCAPCVATPPPPSSDTQVSVGSEKGYQTDQTGKDAEVDSAAASGYGQEIPKAESEVNSGVGAVDKEVSSTEQGTLIIGGGGSSEEGCESGLNDVSIDCCVSCDAPCRRRVVHRRFRGRAAFRRRTAKNKHHRTYNRNKRSNPNISQCNDEKLRVVMESQITTDVTSAKRRIQAAAEAHFGVTFNVICSTKSFSFLLYTEKYCQASRGSVTCYAFNTS
ncbi:unnamed protein product [Thelazia callipaeda]|uniref:Ground-like domain-containing protein n=1 Tax=Thelazia callipaeda TaxID=103827 RepID=A0A0N5CV25_THECL|nr:unnamed protein product [Thelazia callipaeda]